MKTIEIDTSLFALIWSKRMQGEDCENEILHRLLDSESMLEEGKTSSRSNDLPTQHIGKVRWVDDVLHALDRLGGEASLHEIYKEVKNTRKRAGRSVPPSLEATIRRTIEDHSSDSNNFRGVDHFRKLGRGRWGIRPIPPIDDLMP